SSTAITGNVTLKNSAGTTITSVPMTQRSDGTWLINAPSTADISQISLTFTLPAGATIVPGNGSLQDFSDGKTVVYIVISANAKNYAEYQVRLVTAGGQTSEPTLVNTDVSDWKLDKSENANGSVTFIVGVPLEDETASPDSVDVALGSGSYSGVNIIKSSGTLLIMGTAPSMSELQKMSISSLTWTLNGSEYSQTIDPPVTYEALMESSSISDGNRNESAAPSDEGSGCAVPFLPWPFLAALLAAGVAARRKRS
ncbi:MAG: hypothetical protein LBR38_04940, partial [Synergistaceae bacterium]|nr:hypothetical protein [Synergistaceae bacterium]